MCVTDIYTDRYADGEEISYEKLRPCSKSFGDRPCNDSFEDEYPVRFLLYTRDSSSRSSASSSQRTPSIIEVIDEAEAPRRSSSSSRRRSKKPFAGLVLNAFFGEPRRRRRRTSERSVSVERRSVFIEEPTVKLPRAMTPPPPPPLFSTPPTRGLGPMGRPFTSSSPISPDAPATPVYGSRYDVAPVIVDASPRTRGRPVIVDNRRDERRSARRSDSTEVHVTISRTQSRERSPSPLSYEERQRLVREAADEERRRRRDVRIANLDADVSEERRRRRQREYIQVQDAEISARPPRPVIQQEMPIRGILRAPRTPVEAAPRRSSIIDDLQLGRRGEEVILEAIAARERDESRASEDAREVEAQRTRLRRRFSDASNAGPSERRPRERRERIVYSDGTYSYAPRRAD